MEHREGIRERKSGKVLQKKRDLSRALKKRHLPDDSAEGRDRGWKPNAKPGHREGAGCVWGTESRLVWQTRTVYRCRRVWKGSQSQAGQHGLEASLGLILKNSDRGRDVLSLVADYVALLRAVRRGKNTPAVGKHVSVSAFRSSSLQLQQFP